MNNNETSSASSANQTASNSKKAKNNKKTGKKPIIVISVVIIILIAAVVVVATNPFHWFNKSTDEQTEETGTNMPAGLEMTEDEKATTKKVLDENADVQIGEVVQVEDEHGTNEAVKVTVKNIGKEKANIAVDIIAKDKDNNVLDVASLYAEGIEPEQTQEFRVFELSKLTGDQLRSAKYEIHKAYTYEVSTEETEQTENNEQ